MYEGKVKHFNILSVEDNEADFLLLKKAFEKIKDKDLSIVNIDNGKDALKYIYKEGPYKTATTPDLIILDLNLPTVSGFEILKKIKKDECFCVIPIIIYTTSDNECDIWASYGLLANSYVTKTFDLDEMYKKISIIGEYWLTYSELPNHDMTFEI